MTIVFPLPMDVPAPVVERLRGETRPYQAPRQPTFNRLNTTGTGQRQWQRRGGFSRYVNVKSIPEWT